jgi:hypothetical protein
MIIKKFNLFKEEFNLSQPSVKPTVKPDVKPDVKPRRPSPIRRDKPAVKPDPKALKTSTIEDVIDKYVKLTDDVK